MSRRWPKRVCLVLAALLVFLAVRACAELMREPGMTAAQTQLEQTDITGLCQLVEEGEPLREEQQDLLMEQTGLGRPGLEAVLEDKNGDYLLECQQAWFAQHATVCVDNGLTSSEELLVDARQPAPYDLQAGDILVSLNSHTVATATATPLWWWRETGGDPGSRHHGYRFHDPLRIPLAGLPLLCAVKAEIRPLRRPGGRGRSGGMRRWST